MKILINTASTFKGGGIQVSKSYIEEFKNFPDNKYYVVLSKNLAKTIDTNNFPVNFKFHTANFRPSTKFFSFQSHNYFLKEIEKKWQPDIVFSVAGPSYWRPKAKHIIGYTIPHYVYPESPYFDIISIKRKMSWKARAFLAKYLFKRDADVFITQTDDISNRLKKLLNKDAVYTVSNTINNYFTNPIKVANKLLTKDHVEFRLLTLSAWYPHKNIDIIPKVVDSLNKKGYPNIKFVLTLPKDDFKKLKNHKQILNVGKIKIEEGASLYEECDAMFLPTLLECFSASYAEAMVMKMPILTSDLGFAHTVCEDAAIYFNPMDADAIADKIISLYNSEELQTTLVKKGVKRLENFGTAHERAKHVLEICKSLK